MLYYTTSGEAGASALRRSGASVASLREEKAAKIMLSVMILMIYEF